MISRIFRFSCLNQKINSFQGGLLQRLKGSYKYLVSTEILQLPASGKATRNFACVVTLMFSLTKALPAGRENMGKLSVKTSLWLSSKLLQGKLNKYRTIQSQTRDL